MLVHSGTPEWLAKTIAGCDEAIAKDALFDDSRQLSMLIGRPTTPMAVTVAQLLRG